MMVPQVLSIIQATTSGEQRARTLGYYGATAGIGMVLGQLLGGLLVAADVAGTGWRLIFLVNVPIGLLGLVLAGATLPESRAARPLGVDARGTALLGISLLALLIPLMEGRALGWPVWCWVLLGAFPFAAASFVDVERRLERRGRVPLLPMSMLQTAGMRRGLALVLLFFTAFGGFMFVYALTLQDGLRLGPLASGLALTPLAVAFLFSSLVSSRLVARFGNRAVVAGAAVQVLGLLVLIGMVLTAWPDLNVVNLALGTLLCGAGQGLTAPTLFRVVLSRVPAESAGVGSGMLITTQQTSLALGVATLGTLYAALAAPGGIGVEAALVAVTGIQAVMVATIAVAARRLPDPRS
jgi:MFS family permease